MKYTTLCVLLAILGLSSAATDLYPRGCIYVNGRCREECPVGTHAYTTGCGYLTPQATCANPNPVQDTRGKICDYSACYCDAPTVRDEKTGQCVNLDECTNCNP